MTAVRSGWIAAVRGRNDTGVSGAKLAALGFRPANRPPSAARGVRVRAAGRAARFALGNGAEAARSVVFAVRRDFGRRRVARSRFGCLAMIISLPWTRRYG